MIRCAVVMIRLSAACRARNFATAHRLRGLLHAQRLAELIDAQRYAMFQLGVGRLGCTPVSALQSASLDRISALGCKEFMQHFARTLSIAVAEAMIAVTRSRSLCVRASRRVATAQPIHIKRFAGSIAHRPIDDIGVRLINSYLQWKLIAAFGGYSP